MLLNKYRIMTLRPFGRSFFSGIEHGCGGNLHAVQAGMAEVCSPEIRAGKIGASEIGLFKTGLAQIAF